MRLKALVIVRDGKLSRFLVRLLNEQGFAADAAAGQQGFAQARLGLYDLAIVDVDKLDSCIESDLRELRDRGETLAVLALESRGRAHGPSALLRAGADDYLAKPFDIEELIVRIHAVVRRPAGCARIQFGPLEIDRVGAVARHHGVDLKLSLREFALLACLASRGTVVTKQELLARIWSDADQLPASNIVEVTMSRLRDRLGDSRHMIETVRGTGYRLVQLAQPPKNDSFVAVSSAI